MITPGIFASTGKVSPPSSQLMRTLAQPGRGKILEKVTSVASSERAAVSAVITINRDGVITGSYLACSKKKLALRMDPSWFSIPAEIQAQFSIILNLDLSLFVFPGYGRHRNLSSWSDGE